MRVINIDPGVVPSVPFPSQGMLITAPHTTKPERVELFSALAALKPSADLFWTFFEPVSAAHIKKRHHDQLAPLERLKLLPAQD